MSCSLFIPLSRRRSNFFSLFLCTLQSVFIGFECTLPLMKLFIGDYWRHAFPILDVYRHMRDIASMLRHSLRSLDTWWERKCLSTSARQFSAIFNQYVQYHQWLRNSKMDILVYQSRYSHAYWIILRFIM